ncbi:MAG: MBL fold metallo-hydrolase [Deltaproteobacteria bacterium]|nr:MBL fold metallo-hydrolase [Deltaproteobacteria bacterium]
MTRDFVKEWETGLIRLAPEIYAYVQAAGSAGISNAGLVIGPDRAIVVDALATSPMALDFLGRIRTVTGLPVTHVFVTHHHADHFLGLQNFLPAQIVSHSLCREEILRVAPDVIERWSKGHPQLADGLRGVRICFPDQTFEGEMTFHLGDLEIRFFHLGTGHTRGDGLIYLPRRKLLFAGDVAFHKVTPQGFHGHIGNWIRIVGTILEMDVEIIVPGHGPVGGKAELMEMRDYLLWVYNEAKNCFNRGLSESEAVTAIDVGPYRSWAEAGRLKGNIERSYSEFRGELPI